MEHLRKTNKKQRQITLLLNADIKFRDTCTCLIGIYPTLIFSMLTTVRSIVFVRIRLECWIKDH